MPARVLLLGRAGCHLCDDARAVVEAVCGERGEAWEEVDIDTDADLKARYGDEIPVVKVDGETVGFWRIDADRLHRALS
ncbi:glutaredoxin family protein [Demequina mangrovi]|uniref:Glutaredoxin-like domain n=1 Tax=Demequina mangrovi TaxID=1043493 RepID=A0A1H6W7Z2_9MICO|nr:glutaredoxin family protein [Demequina mangrovi]SEJ13161.1 Glutaredoxin-like domain [Demequina mangrovi]